MNQLLSNLRSLVSRLDSEDEEAYNLWTCLPSYKVAEKYHGDYAAEKKPSNKDVMVEACMLIAELKNLEFYKEHPSAKHKKWFEECPCGEFCHKKEKS